MQWNAIYYNANKRKIETYNIFEHRTFLKYVKKDAEQCADKEEFAQALKSELRFYFWAKAEWEIFVAPWVGGDREKEGTCIDPYDQIINNWDIFVDYVWDNRKELLEFED